MKDKQEKNSRGKSSDTFQLRDFFPQGNSQILGDIMQVDGFKMHFIKRRNLSLYIGFI